MDVRIEAAPFLATAEMTTAVTISPVVVRVVMVPFSGVVASIRIPSKGKTSLSAIPAPFKGGPLARAA